MASLNAAECFRLYDRGAIAPGLRADIVLLDDLEDFNVRRVFIEVKKLLVTASICRKFTSMISPQFKGA